MDNSVDHVASENQEDHHGRSSSCSEEEEDSPLMDRNPSPPPTASDIEEEAGAGEDDAIVGTAYSKHWLFGTLTRLIQIVTREEEKEKEKEKEGGEGGGGDSAHMQQLTDEEEESLCRVWDMAMDSDVAGFLQEFKAADILLGVIAKSRCPRLTEICVGILGNIACFPDTCLSLSHNHDLGEVLLLLLGDTDPRTLLETSRLLVTCLSQKDVSALWLRRIRQHSKSVRSHLTFIVSSSTNVELVVKVGELLDKLFDLDEELMKTWITEPPSGGGGGGDEEDEENEGRGGGVDVPSSLLEAAKQLRSESPEGLEVYLHVLQLLTTTDEGIHALAAPDGPGRALWDFVRSVAVEDLLQPGDPALVLQEQKLLLLHSLDVLSALYSCLDPRPDACLPLVGVMLRVLRYNGELLRNKAEEVQRLLEDRKEADDTHKDQREAETTKDQQEADHETPKDQHLQSLVETTTGFLADLLSDISKEEASELVTAGSLTEEACGCAAAALLPHFSHVVEHLASTLTQTHPLLAHALRRETLPVSQTTT